MDCLPWSHESWAHPSPTGWAKGLAVQHKALQAAGAAKGEYSLGKKSVGRAGSEPHLQPTVSLSTLSSQSPGQNREHIINWNQPLWEGRVIHRAPLCPWHRAGHTANTKTRIKTQSLVFQVSRPKCVTELSYLTLATTWATVSSTISWDHLHSPPGGS